MHDVRRPLLMGAAMGLIMPWMMHMDGEIGLMFILAHAALLIPLAALSLFVPQVRSRVRAHLSPAHAGTMVGAAAFGWAATCAACLAIGGVHWT